MMNPDFVRLLSRQRTLIQQLAQLNAEAILGIGMPRKPDFMQASLPQHPGTLRSSHGGQAAIRG